MSDHNINVDEPFETILQRPLTSFEKQQTQNHANPSHPDANTASSPLRRRLKDLAQMQASQHDHSLA